MHQATILTAPIILPVRRKFFRGRNVPDGRIEPHIHHFTVGTINGYGHAPVAVARHGAGLQALVNPTFALAVHIVFPFLMAFQQPLAQPRFVILQRQIPMLGGFLNRGRLREGTAWVNEFFRTQGIPAFFALVAVGIFVGAMRTRSHNVAVGQEHIFLFIVKLFRFAFFKQAFIVQGFEKGFRGFVMHCIRSARKNIERNANRFQTLVNDGMVFINNRLRRNAFLHGANGNGHAVFVGTTNKIHIFFLRPQKARVNIGR